MATCPASSDELINPSNHNGVIIAEGTTLITLRVLWPKELLVDLDLAAVLFDEHGTATELVSYSSPTSSDAARTVSLVTGDQRSGDIGEAIVVRLANISSSVDAIGFLVTCPDTKRSMTEIQELHVLVTTEGTYPSSEESDPLPSSWKYTCVPRDDADELRLRDPIQMRMVASIQRNRADKYKKKSFGKSGDEVTGDWVLRVHRNLVHGLSARDAAATMAVVLGYCHTASEAHVSFPFPLYLEKDQCFHIREDANGERGHRPRHLSHNEVSNGAFLTVGVGWDVPPATSGAAADDGTSSASDIDLSCVAINVHERNPQSQIKDMLFWGKITGLNGAVTHSGDNTDGEGDGLDEFLTIDLSRIPQNVTTLAFIVSSYNKPTLDAARNILFSVARSSDEGVLVLMEGIGSGGSYTSFIPCVLERHEEELGGPFTSSSNASSSSRWRIRVLSLPVVGHSVSDEATRASVCATVIAASGRGGGQAAPRALHIRRSAEVAQQRRQQGSAVLNAQQPQRGGDALARSSSTPADYEPSKLVVWVCVGFIIVVAAYVLKGMGL